MTKANHSRTLTLSRAQSTISGLPAPHVWVSIAYAGKHSRRVLARVDTGADITALPAYMVRDIGVMLPLVQPNLIISMSQPIYAYSWSCLLYLWNADAIFATVKPARGVLLGHSALVGMDVLSHFRIEGGKDKWTLHK